MIEEATRSGVVPLIGVYGASGTGKTHSALLLARGLAGDKKQIGIIDTERKRSGALVGLIPGNFKRINLEAPFTPHAYTQAIREAEAAGWGAVVIDSMTHEWDGEGGVLEMQEAELDRMAGDDFKKREACKMAAWIKPKQEHKALVKYILRSSIPIICCLRAQEKTRMDKDANGKTRVSTDVCTTPIFDSRFIFEMLVNVETIQVEGKPGCAFVTKWTHPDILTALPAQGEQIGVKHGAALAAWCNQDVRPEAPRQTKPVAGSPTLAGYKKELWELTRRIHAGDAKALEQWLWDEALIMDTETLEGITAEEFPAIIQKARAKLTT